MNIAVARIRVEPIRQGLPTAFCKRGPCRTPSHSTWTSNSCGLISVNPYNNAYLEIRRVLRRHGFAWQQGSDSRRHRGHVRHVRSGGDGFGEIPSLFLRPPSETFACCGSRN